MYEIIQLQHLCKKNAYLSKQNIQLFVEWTIMSSGRSRSDEKINFRATKSTCRFAVAWHTRKYTIRLVANRRDANLTWRKLIG